MPVDYSAIKLYRITLELILKAINEREEKREEAVGELCTEADR